MKKNYIIKKSKDFTNIIKKSKYYKKRAFTIYIKDNDLDHSRFGISVTTNSGNAVIRNKIKRQMRMIINESKKDYKKNLDYIIIVKKPFISYSYQEMKEDYEKAIKSINS